MTSVLLVAAVMTQSKVPWAPPMPLRPISSNEEAWDGKASELDAGDYKMTLFLPNGWNEDWDGVLTIHFHTIAWHTIQEHERRGSKRPLVVFVNGQGSSKYREPMLDKGRFGRWIKLLEGELEEPVTGLELTSFSAGYGAIREIVQQPEYFDLIRRVVLFDSMYAGFETEGEREPQRDQIDVWVPLAKAAKEGKKTFLFTVSDVPTETFASSSECALALLSRFNSKWKDTFSTASLDELHPLLKRYDSGNLHVWLYGGQDGAAHLTHVRHMGSVLASLDRSGKP